MGEIQEQKYVCRICSKSCVSGKSLGGHMRVHLALLSASKKASQGKMEFEGGDNQQNGSFQLRKSSKNQEKIMNCKGNMDFVEANQNNSYGLRENPKKSWRINSDHSKRGVSKKGSSCEERGKELSSLKALSGHNMCHSIKNGEVHYCKKCGKGFDSMRALFGHMKSHSKKSRIRDDCGESLSDLENLCPIRGKRSRIKYNITLNPRVPCLNASSSSAGPELGEVEWAATCLMMLSRGVNDRNRLKNLATESSNDDSVFFGGGKDGGFVCDSDEMLKPDCCVSASASAFWDKKVSDFDDPDVENKMKVNDFDEAKVDLEVSDDGLQWALGGHISWHRVNENVSPLDMNMNASMLSTMEFDSKIDQCGQESLELSKSKESYECPICFKCFSSGQALGGHKRAHYLGVAESKTNKITSVDQETTGICSTFDLNFPLTV